MLRTVPLSVSLLLTGLARAEVTVIPFGTPDVTMESVHADTLPRQSRVGSNRPGADPTGIGWALRLSY